MALRFLLVFLAMILGTTAHARPFHWVTIASDGFGRMAVYMDAGSVERDGDTVRAHFFYVREAALENGEFFKIGSLQFDCRRRYLTDLGSTSYAEDGSELKSEGPVPRARAARGSIGLEVLSAACGERPALTENVENPVEHALSMLTGRSAESASAQAEAATEPAAPEEADAGGVSTGTGFFVGPNGFLLTSYHVVQGASEIVVRTASGQVLTATIYRASPRNDLAVLRVDHRPARHLSFAPPGSIHTGDRVFTLGYPVVSMLGVAEPRFSDGTVSALSGAGNEDSWLQISVPVQPGNSGGPLLNESGQVVGVVAAQAAIRSFMQETGTLPQNINWAVKAEYALPLIGAMAPAPVRTRSEAIANAREAVVVIAARQEARE